MHEFGIVSFAHSLVLHCELSLIRFSVPIGVGEGSGVIPALNLPI